MLIPLLLITSLLLGLVFGGAGLGSASGGAGGQASSAAPNPPITTSPYLLAIAESTGLPSGNFTPTTGGTGQFTPVPLAGLRLILTEVGAGNKFNRGRPTSFQVVTNSSGEVFASMSEGNFSVTSSGTGFNFTKTVEFRAGVTTVLRLDITPVESGASSVVIINQDTVSTIEPGAVIYAKFAENFTFAVNSTVQLTGWTSAVSGGTGAGLLYLRSAQRVEVSCTVIGEYEGAGGTWVAMQPSAPFQSIPALGVVFISYQANSTVSYLAD